MWLGCRNFVTTPTDSNSLEWGSIAYGDGVFVVGGTKQVMKTGTKRSNCASFTCGTGTQSTTLAHLTVCPGSGCTTSLCCAQTSTNVACSTLTTQSTCDNRVCKGKFNECQCMWITSTSRCADATVASKTSSPAYCTASFNVNSNTVVVTDGSNCGNSSGVFRLTPSSFLALLFLAALSVFLKEEMPSCSCIIK